MTRRDAILTWLGLVCAVVVPLVVAATSPLLEWRQPTYIVAGFAGIVGLGLLLIQPLLAAVLLPGVNRAPSRRLHRLGGVLLVGAVVVHVAGLWVFSPPDVIDALTLRSPTPFSIWGVLAMWAIFAAAALAALRKTLPLRPTAWRKAHSICVALAAGGTVAHAMLIQGTMGPLSKAALCVLVVGATARAVWPVWRRRQRAG